MSATVTDDAFLIKGLKLKKETIQNPLTAANETWSGEKMVILPQLIDESLDSGAIQEWLSRPSPKKYGVVALCSGKEKAKPWIAGGSIYVDKNNISNVIKLLKSGEFEKTVVLSNRYDGVDLPDRTCRILIVDGKPYSDNVIDRHHSQIRSSSRSVSLRIARTIEQGLGRAVRGQKDYCAVIIVGADMIEFVRSKRTRGYLSPQTRLQIELGLEIAEMVKSDLRESDKAIKAVTDLLNQSLRRDEGWKQFYTQRMDGLVQDDKQSNTLEIFSLELDAELEFQDGNVTDAMKIIQSIMDIHIGQEDEKGWYLARDGSILFQCR